MTVGTQAAVWALTDCDRQTSVAGVFPLLLVSSNLG